MVHESSATLVLSGDLLIVQLGGGYVDSRFIWQAVDEFKPQGHTLNSVLGEGTQANPHQWYIVISK